MYSKYIFSFNGLNKLYQNTDEFLFNNKDSAGFIIDSTKVQKSLSPPPANKQSGSSTISHAAASVDKEFHNVVTQVETTPCKQ